MELRPKGTGSPISPSFGEPGINMAGGATAPSLPITLVDCGEPGIDTADGVAAPSLPVQGDGIVTEDWARTLDLHAEPEKYEIPKYTVRRPCKAVVCRFGTKASAT